jgi:hypothetical protein
LAKRTRRIVILEKKILHPVAQNRFLYLPSARLRADLHVSCSVTLQTK